MSYRPFFDEHLKGTKWGREGRGMAFCPFHEDKKRSLSMEETRGLWYCFACAIGGTVFSLAEKLGVSSPEKSKKTPIGCYIYRDENRAVLFRILRAEGKKFWAEKYVAGGRWEPRVEGVRLVPYNLEAIIGSSVFIIIVEGEKDVETLIKLGFVATTNPFGAGRWKKEFNHYFQERDVVILPDNDDPGKKHAEDVRHSLSGIARRVRILNLPGLPDKGDVTDWMGLEHTGDELLKMCEALLAPEVPEGEAKKTPIIEISSAPESPKTIPIDTDKEFPPFPAKAWVGFLATWRDLVGPCSESPESFHFATLTAVLGLYLGRDFYFTYPHPTFQNYYFLLVGKTSLASKTTSIGWGHTLCTELDQNIKWASGLSSAEGVFRRLGENVRSRLLVFNDEMRVLFANARRPGTQNLLPHLNSLYNCPHQYNILQVKEIKIDEGMLTMVSATTKEWMRENEEIEAAFGGFLNRNLCLVGASPRPISNPDPPDTWKWIPFVEAVKKWRGEFSKGDGRIIKGAAAMDRYRDWYDPWWHEINKSPDTVASLCGRMREHVMKLAAFYSLLNSRMEIQPEDVERAIAVTEYSAKCSLTIFKDVTLSRRGKLEERIKEVLKRGPMSRRMIRRSVSSSYDREELARALKALMESAEIKFRDEEGYRGHPSEIFELVREED